MSKPRSRVADYGVYLLVHIVVAVIQALPPHAARAFARGLAWLAYHVDRRHRAAAHENLQHAFAGQLTEAERAALVWEVYRHFCTLLVEIILLPRKLHLHNWRRYLDLSTGRPLVECL